MGEQPVKKKDFYPRPPRGGRPPCVQRNCKKNKISIHALREEGDGSILDYMGVPTNFYPRPPRGGRLNRCRQVAFSKRFLSTPSARRATELFLFLHDTRIFLSTPSARRATVLCVLSDTFLSISIHALREEGDFKRKLRIFQQRYFYPRPPRGGRLYAAQEQFRRITNFYPRPPRGGRRVYGI